MQANWSANIVLLFSLLPGQFSWDHYNFSTASTRTTSVSLTQGGLQ